jgi:hypothetical protein
MSTTNGSALKEAIRRQQREAVQDRGHAAAGRLIAQIKAHQPEHAL